VRPKADLPTEKKSIHSSNFRDRPSGIYDFIVDDAIAPSHADTMQPYDEIPDNAASQPPPYQHLIADTREEPSATPYMNMPKQSVAIGTGDAREDDDGYTIALVDVYDERTSLQTSQEQKRLSKHNYLTLLSDVDDVEELSQQDRGGTGASTSISDLYAKVHKTGYRRLEPQSREHDPPVKDYTKLESGCGVNGEEQLCYERTALFEETNEKNNIGRTGDDEDIVKCGCNLPNTYNANESIAIETPLNQDTSGIGDFSPQDHYALNSGARELSTDMSAASTTRPTLQQHDTLMYAVGAVYHGLDATTRDTRPRVAHEYSTLIDK